MKNISLVLLLFTITSWSHQEKVMIILDGNCSLEIVRETFNPKEHKIDYKDNFVIAIDNPLFGSDGEIPKFTLSKAILKIGEKSYNL